MQSQQPMAEVSIDDLLRLIGLLYVENRVLQQQIVALQAPRNGIPDEAFPVIATG